MGLVEVSGLGFTLANIDLWNGVGDSGYPYWGWNRSPLLLRSSLGGGAIQVDAWVKAPKADQPGDPGEMPEIVHHKNWQFRDL